MEKYCHVLCFHQSKKNCSFPSERFQQDRIFFFVLCTPDNWISFFICQKNVRALILLRTLGVVAWNYLWFMTTVIKDLKPGIQRIDMTNMLDAALDFFAEDMCFIYPKCKKGTKSHRMTDFEGAYRMRNCTTFCRRPGWPVCGASSSSSSLQDFESPRRPRGIFRCICKGVSERSGREGETDGWCSPRARGWYEGRRRQSAEHLHPSLFTALLGWEKSLEHAQQLCHAFPARVKCTFKPGAKIGLSAIMLLRVCCVVMTVRKVTGTPSKTEAFISSRSESRFKTLFWVLASSNHLPSV